MIKVQICQGTTCYVMGAGNLVQWINTLPDEVKWYLQISGCHCLKLCTDGAFDGAPYVSINGKIISAATPQNIKAALLPLLPPVAAQMLADAKEKP